MLLLILLQFNYYFYTSDNCIPCKRQLPIIERLQEEGFNFEIIENSDEVEVYPTIIIEIIDYKNQKVKQIKLEGFQSYHQLSKKIKWLKRQSIRLTSDVVQDRQRLFMRRLRTLRELMLSQVRALQNIEHGNFTIEQNENKRQL